MPQLKPSRTFTIAIYAITAILLVALAGLGLVAFVAWLAPEQLAVVCSALPVVGTVALAIAGAGGFGSGAMGLRDYGSGGLTSSSAASVLAGRRQGPRGPTTGPTSGGAPGE